MLSLASEGVASKWMTGALGMAPQSILETLDIDAAAERFMGVIVRCEPVLGVPAPVQ